MVIRAPILLKTAFNRLRRDESGVGAVEFAFIFPLLLLLYITAFELTVAFSMYKRTSSAAGSIADLIGRESSVELKTLATMKDFAKAIYAPYSSSGLKINVTGVLTDASGNGKVSWSWNELNAAPYAKGSSVNLPTAMRTANRFLVHTEVEIPHSILRFMTTAETAITPITLRREYFYDKRQDEPITCKDCK